LVREKGLAPRTGNGHKEDAVVGKKQAHWRINSSKIIFLLLLIVVIVVIFIIVIIMFGRAFTLVTAIFAAAFANAC
jgi:t-SNARE complex subunit (syntaxin)